LYYRDETIRKFIQYPPKFSLNEFIRKFLVQWTKNHLHASKWEAPYLPSFLKVIFRITKHNLKSKCSITRNAVAVNSVKDPKLNKCNLSIIYHQWKYATFIFHAPKIINHVLSHDKNKITIKRKRNNGLNQNPNNIPLKEKKNYQTISIY
jgi:hypothetical protein